MSDELQVQAPATNIDLLKQQDDHQFEIAKRNIDATLQNNRELRQHFQTLNKNGLIVTIVVLIMLFVFGIYALYLGKEQFWADTLKVVAGAFGGGGIGYAIGRKKQENKN